MIDNGPLEISRIRTDLNQCYSNNELPPRKCHSRADL